jgi:hypothetical protein
MVHGLLSKVYSPEIPFFYGTWWFINMKFEDSDFGLLGYNALYSKAVTYILE